MSRRRALVEWVEGDGCLMLPGQQRDYATLRRGGKSYTVSRQILSYKIGRPLLKHEMACHTCDNPPCIRPEHLFLGDAGANMVDAVKKGRRKRSYWPHPGYGEKNRQAKITEAQAIEIKRRRLAGEKAITLGREFGITDVMVCRIALGRAWRHLS